ncbi:transketolase (plasmid) [Desulfobaculum bizertense]|uniref:transketolase n=1 Tax=Desulfobaculum bizertense TaxID=376490 RepID=UPI001F306934|nr:transketolase [Desulfobaculum bizertense]UIJ39547.1 transketolase [Desulfobaculum bizertense]
MTNKVDLEQFALKIRRGIVDAIAAKGGGHIGGSLDLAELLSVLYSNYMRVDPANPDWDERDFLICSKGHAGPALYATLALKGFFPYETLLTLNQEGSMLPGHCDRCKVPGVDATSGSLGQGLSIACGLALSSRLRSKNQRVFCVIGDGEAAEGQIWEAAQFASHFELDNLILFLDWNKMQIDGPNDKVMSLGDPVQKFQSFGWRACKVEEIMFCSLMKQSQQQLI